MDNISLEFIDRGSNAEDDNNEESGSIGEGISNVEDVNKSRSESDPNEESKTKEGSNDGGSKESINRKPPWWTTIPRNEGVLAGLLICTTIIMITLIATCYLKKPEVVKKKGTCMTPGCIHTASRILADMDPDVEPCDDFYSFTCGNFERSNEIPDDESIIDRWSAIRDKVRSQIRMMLEERIKPDEPKPFVLVKNLYKTCMNNSLNESLEIQPFSKTLESFGGWPVLKGADWDEAGFDWMKTLIEFKKKGFKFNQFFKVSVATLVSNPAKYTVQVDELSDSDFGNIRKYLIRNMRNHIVVAYYNYMVDIAVLLGAPKERAASEMKEALLFEMTLADISLARTVHSSTNVFAIDDFRYEFPTIDWMEYLNALLPPGVTNKDIAEVYAEANNNIEDLEYLLINTPRRIMANYLMWKITFDNIELLTEDFRKREVEYKTVVHGMKPIEIPRLEYCSGLIRDRFYNIFFSLYAKKHFNADARSNVIDMINRIKAAVTKTVKNVDWMDGDTRIAALEKVANMTSFIGYPDELLDVNKLEEYYKGLEIDENGFRQSLLNMKTFFSNKYFSKLNDPVKKKENSTIQKDFTNTTTFYLPLDNSVNFPVGIFQGVFFSTDRPQYMNYGAIGYVIGHEIIHGLNDVKSQIGMLLFNINFNWWTPTTTEAYLKKAQCFIEQYGNYTVDEENLNINGNKTQQENVADNGAIKGAYSAYAKWVEENGEEPQLPGLNYTSKQMFWLSAGSMLCSKYTPEEMKKYIEKNGHSPRKYRVVGPLSNSKDFAKDFKCPPGSPMNPLHKCKVW